MSTTPSRTTIKFSLPQILWLREESARLGITLADLVRRIIDQHRAHAADRG